MRETEYANKRYRRGRERVKEEKGKKRITKDFVHAQRSSDSVAFIVDKRKRRRRINVNMCACIDPTDFKSNVLSEGENKQNKS